MEGKRHGEQNGKVQYMPASISREDRDFSGGNIQKMMAENF